MGQFGMLEDEIGKILKEQGVSHIDKNSVEYRRLCANIFQAEIKGFTKFKKRCGIDTNPRRKTFLSFRHTAINSLMHKEIPDRVVAMLVGHVTPGQTGGRYAKPFKPKKRMDSTVLQLDFGIDLSHLKDSKYVPKK